MNIVDIIILALLGISVLFGLYRGFIASVASLGGCLLSLGAASWLNPKLVEWVNSHPEYLQTLMSYTDAGTRIGDQTLAQTSVSGLSGTAISEVLSRVNLPAPLSTLLQNNLQGQVFQNMGLTHVGDYVSQTIVSAVVNVLCFLVCFLGCFLVIHILLNFLKVVFRFPVLKQMNALMGGAFGLLRGVFLCFLAFALIPLIQTMVPIKGIEETLSGSQLAPFFNNRDLILSIMRGRL